MYKNMYCDYRFPDFAVQKNFPYDDYSTDVFHEAYHIAHEKAIHDNIIEFENRHTSVFEIKMK